MARSAAYQLGYDAYFGPMSGKKNPHPEGSQAHADWWDGFNAAQADCAW